MSANESSCNPIGEYAFSKRAMNPSKKSNMAAAKMQYAAISNEPLKAKEIAKHPEKRFSDVMVLGMCFVIDFKTFVFLMFNSNTQM